MQRIPQDAEGVPGVVAGGDGGTSLTHLLRESIPTAFFSLQGSPRFTLCSTPSFNFQQEESIPEVPFIYFIQSSPRHGVKKHHFPSFTWAPGRTCWQRTKPTENF